MRNKELAAWLRENARGLRHQPLPGGGGVEWYSVNGRVLIVHSFGEGQGEMVFLPASETNLIADEMAALYEWQAADPQRER